FTCAQIFTNIATANAYHLMFKAIIKTVNELSKGLCLVLADLDPTKTWKTHLTYNFKSCH
ncbi:450_t:CDS:2, partial [Gigaspora rosea]